jgi:hypothetical protein
MIKMPTRRKRIPRTMLRTRGVNMREELTNRDFDGAKIPEVSELVCD